MGSDLSGGLAPSAGAFTLNCRHASGLSREMSGERKTAQRMASLKRRVKMSDNILYLVQLRASAIEQAMSETTGGSIDIAPLMPRPQ